MNWLSMQNVAQVSVEHVLNSLPEGLLVALFAWLLLRLIRRQNSGTRFAVWFTALLAIVGLAFVGGFKLSEGPVFLPTPHFGAQFTVPAFWAAVIFSVWVLASSMAFVRLLAGLWQIWVIRRSSTEIDLSQLDPAIEETFRQHAVGRRVRLAISERVKVPAAIGLWKPAIVLPAWALQELTPNELKPILIHELTHLRRHDDWTNLLQKIMRALFFFHPAVWWIDARLSLEREMACDDAVLANTGDPQAYASCLIELLEKSCARRGWTMAQAAVHRARELSLRITQILDAKRPATTRLSKPVLAWTSVFSLACLGISYCAPRLVAFGPSTSDYAMHVAKTGIALSRDQMDMTGMRAKVVPASFHIPTSTTFEKHPAVSRKTTKHNSRSNPAVATLASEYRQQEITPHLVMAKAIESTSGKESAPVAQMVVFVTTVRYVQPDNNDSPRTNAAGWTTQVWQIVLVTPVAQNAGQADVVGSLI